MKLKGSIIVPALSMLASAMPGPLRNFIASACTAIYYIFSPARRQSLAENLSHIGIEPSDRLLYGIFRLHTENIIDMITAGRLNIESLAARFEFTGRQELDSALAQGKGAILVTEHIGGWEAGAVYLRSLGYRLSVVAGVQLSPLLTEEIKRTKEKLGIEVINPQDTARKFLKALSSGGVLALLVDGNIFNGGIELPFFGKPAVLPDGPVRLAKATGAPIVAGYCRRLKSGNFKIHIEHLMEARDIEEIGERKALEKMYKVVERFISENADQWIMFRRFWEKDI